MSISQAQSRFLTAPVRVHRIYQGKAELKYNLIVHFTCMCWLRLSLTAYKQDSGMQNNRYQ